MSASVFRNLTEQLPALEAQERLAAIEDHMAGAGTMATSDRSDHLRDLRERSDGGERRLSTVAQVAALATEAGFRVERGGAADAR